MKTKHFIISLLALSLTCLTTACSSEDSDDSVISEKEEGQEDEKGMVKLTSANLTEEGYFDGVMYYKITSNSPLEVCVAKAEKSAVNIVIPSKVSIDGRIHKCTSVGEKAFYKCSNLTSITIPNSIQIIRDSAFADCGSIESIMIPSSINTIENYAFYNCTGLKVVNIEDIAKWCNVSFSDIYSNPLTYAHHLYKDNNEVNDLVIPNSVTSIGDIVFNGCTGLTSVIIPNSVTRIGGVAFQQCRSLSSITIPNSVTTIEVAAFNCCTGLKEVTIGDFVTYIGIRAFSQCDLLESVIIGKSVKKIDNKAFNRCKKLTSVIIPDSVTTIGESAFSECTHLASVTLPNSLKTILADAFQSCPSLSAIRCHSTKPPKLYNNPFPNELYSKGTLYIPIGSKTAYQSSEYWNYFKNIIEE